VTVGLRPDAFAWPRPDGLPELTGTALGVESLGDERHVLFAALGGPPVSDEPLPETVGELWTARVPARCQVALGVDLDQLYLFDVDSGAAVPEATVPTEAGVAA
jgi:multiple sugar transport system ATP-binding protein